MDLKSKSTSDAAQNELDRVLTHKFLNGELTFTEYSQQCSGGDGNESEEEQENSVGISFSFTPGDEEPSGSISTKELKTKRFRKRHHLPPALLGLMGEANLRFARGDKELAEKICFEIIRQVPTAAEPFQTLAQIHEADAEKSLQFTLIAAHLSPSDGDLWMKLASISKERGDKKQELFCYSKAITAKPLHTPYHMARIEAVQELEDKKIVLTNVNLTVASCYMRLIRSLPASEGAKVLQLAKQVAKRYHAEDKMDKAMLAMNLAYDKCKHLFSLEDTNLHLELLLNQKEYNNCLEVLVAKGEINVEAEVQTVSDGDVVEEVTNILSCEIPESLPIDLRSKLIICLIHMKAFHLIESMLESILKDCDVEVAGDIFLDIEEALTSEGCHSEALRLLTPMVNSQRYGLPAVWLKYAECLIALNCTVEAIEPLKTVIRLAPMHLEARVKLSNILIQNDRFEEALKALEQDETTDLLDTGLLYKRYVLLKKYGKQEGALKVGQLLLSPHFFRIRNNEEIFAFRIKDTVDTLKALREGRGEDMAETDGPFFDENSPEIPLQTEWEVLQEIIQTAQDLRHFSTMERIAISALGSKRFHTYKSSLEWMCLIACLNNGDYFFGYNMVRDFITKFPDKPKIWNILNMIIQRIDDIRHNKFLMRFLSRPEANLDRMLGVLHGNNCLMAGSYKYALKEYVTCYKIDKNPLVCLLCGITMLHMCCQKFSTTRHTLFIQGMAFLRYYEKFRGPDGKQEAFYNLGRAYHQLSLFPLAIEYYKRALEVEIDVIKENEDLLDLRQEIAFNLHLLYKNDAPDIARMYLEKYIVV